MGKQAAPAGTDFASADDSVRHTGVAASTQKRGVPLPVVGKYLRDSRAPELRFFHSGKSSDALRPCAWEMRCLPLRSDGSSKACMYSEVRSLREWLGYGVAIQGYRFTLPAWAGDTRMNANSILEIEAMLGGFRQTAQQRECPQLRIPKCTWTPVHVREQDLTRAQGNTSSSSLEGHAMSASRRVSLGPGHLDPVRWMGQFLAVVQAGRRASRRTRPPACWHLRRLALHLYDSGGETVCQICGVRCNPDEPVDSKAHLGGRLHEG